MLRKKVIHGLIYLQSLGRPRHDWRHVSLQRLEELAQPFVTIILFVPHVLVISHFALVVQPERYQTVYGFGLADPLWRVLVLHLPYDFRRRVLDYFRLEGA